jgi:hypothetical protein
MLYGRLLKGFRKGEGVKQKEKCMLEGVKGEDDVARLVYSSYAGSAP